MDIDGNNSEAALEPLRKQVRQAAGRLGWGQGSIARFALALTGKPWERCGEAELREMLEEYEVLIEVVESKRSRKRRAR